MFNCGDLGMCGELRPNHHDHGGAEGLVAFELCRLLGGVGIGAAAERGHGVAEAGAGWAGHDHKAPRSEAAVIGGLDAGAQDAGEFRLVGAGLGQLARCDPGPDGGEDIQALATRLPRK
jgi:hypothetical protein